MPLELIKPGTHIDFIRHARLFACVSAAVIVAGLAMIPVNGIRLGIDFAGGTEFQVEFTEAQPVEEGAIRDVLSGQGVSDASVVRYGDEAANEFLIRFIREDDDGDHGEFVAGLRETLEEEIGPLEVARIEFVGPRVGAELRDDGLAALGWAALLVLVYVAFRFSLRFAPGAIVALLHDVLVTACVWVILGFEFDLRVLAALLAIVGYSLNDTIVIYDRIRENMETRTKSNLPEVINLSLNQTLGRTVLTSSTTLAAVLALLILGGQVIRPFAIAMTIGVLVGTYSSVYIASPLLLVLEGWMGDAREPKPGAGGRAAPAESPRKRAAAKR